MSAFNDQRGREFNEQVAAVLRRAPSYIVNTRVAQVGGLKLPKHFGDIDVLALDRAKRVVRVIECKDLALVRTPDELSNQLATFVPSDAGDDAAATVKHRRCVNWVADNLDAILAALNVPNDGSWRVEGLFVVDEPLFVPHLRQIDMPVVAFEELRRGQESE